MTTNSEGPRADGDTDPHDPVVDAAVRLLVASRRCSPHRALGILLDHSTRTGRPVAEEARRLVAHDSRRGAPLVVYDGEDTDVAATELAATDGRDTEAVDTEAVDTEVGVPGAAGGGPVGDGV